MKGKCDVTEFTRVNFYFPISEPIFQKVKVVRCWSLKLAIVGSESDVRILVSSMKVFRIDRIVKGKVGYVGSVD